MRWVVRLSAAVGLALACFALLAAPARAEGRVALVIGNSGYPAAPLPNPKNDAIAMADMLQRLGFKTILATDLSKEGMDRAIGDFGQALQPGDVALLYYSGHAVQVQSSNYLLPISARPTKATDLVAQAIKASAFLEVMDAANTRLNIVILDACRDNPFLSAQRSISRGLTMIQSSGSETLIAYATEEGRTASDGAGWHSPYAEALLEELPRPGQTLEDVFRNVRARVVEATHGAQRPWTSGSIGTTFYFVPPAPPAPAEAAGTGSSGSKASNAEIVFWESVKDSKSSEEFDAYLSQYPDGEFAPLARLRLKQLAAAAQPSAAAPPASPPASMPPAEAGAPSSMTDAQLWQSVKDSNDPADVTAYLDRYPNGASAATARMRLAELRAQQLWEGIKDSNDPADFKTYLDWYPNGKSVATARTRLAELQAQQLWDAIKNSNDPADFKAYLEQFPKGKSAAAARTRFAELQAQQLWDAIKKSNKAEDYERYLERFPKGAAAAEARKRLAELQPQSQEGPATPDAQLWDSIKNSSKAEDYQKYLNRFPKGASAAQARKRLAELRAAQQQATAATPPSAGSVAPGSRLTGGQIRATIIGNSLQGKSQKGVDITELFLVNGIIKEGWGESTHGGEWAIAGDTLCLHYYFSETHGNDGCYSIILDGDAVQFRPEKDAANWIVSLKLKLVSGNPAGL